MAHLPHIRLSGDTVEILKNTSWYPMARLENIQYVSSLADYSIIYLDQGERIVVLVSLKDAIEILNDEDKHAPEDVDEKEKEKIFIRIHRKYVINMKETREYDKDTLYMKTGKTFPIGRVYRTTIKKVVPRKKKEKKIQVLQMAA